MQGVVTYIGVGWVAQAGGTTFGIFDSVEEAAQVAAFATGNPNIQLAQTAKFF